MSEQNTQSCKERRLEDMGKSTETSIYRNILCINKNAYTISSPKGIAKKFKVSIPYSEQYLNRAINEGYLMKDHKNSYKLNHDRPYAYRQN